MFNFSSRLQLIFLSSVLLMFGEIWWFVGSVLSNPLYYTFYPFHSLTFFHFYSLLYKLTFSLLGICPLIIFFSYISPLSLVSFLSHSFFILLVSYSFFTLSYFTLPFLSFIHSIYRSLSLFLPSVSSVVHCWFFLFLRLIRLHSNFLSCTSSPFYYASVTIRKISFIPKVYADTRKKKCWRHWRITYCDVITGASSF